MSQESSLFAIERPGDSTAAWNISNGGKWWAATHQNIYKNPPSINRRRYYLFYWYIQYDMAFAFKEFLMAEWLKSLVLLLGQCLWLLRIPPIINCLIDSISAVHNVMDCVYFSNADKPVCRPEQKNSYGGAKGLTSEVECHVESKPGATSFRWAFNGTGELVEITSGYRTTADGSISVLRYTPRSELDFGTLLCWAANPLGTQSQPCVYHFYAAGNNNNDPFSIYTYY